MIRRTAWLLMIAAAILIQSLAWNLSMHAAGKAGQDAESKEIGNVPFNSGYRSASERHKIKVAKGDIANDIAARGGRVVGDYGDSVVMEVSTSVANKLKSNQAIELRDEDNLIRLNAGAIDTTTTRAVELQSVNASAPGGEKIMHLVQFAGPVKPAWYEALQATGVEIVSYIPSNAYLVYGDNASIRRIKALARTSSSFVQWEGTYADVYRIDPRILLDQETKQKQKAEALKIASLKGSPAGDEGLFAVQLFKDPVANNNTLQLINQIKTQSIKVQWEILSYVNLVVGLKDSDIKTLAARPDVVSVMQYAVPHKMDERQDMIISGNLTGDLPVTGLSWFTSLANKGFTQAQFTSSNFLVNISDSGIDNANPANPNNFAFHLSGDLTQASRLVYARLEGTPNGGSTLQGCDGHGTENGSIIMGYVASGTVGGVNFNAAPHVDGSGFHFGLGVCPFVKLGSSVIFDPGSFTFPNYANLESEAYNAGSRVSSNSWGADVGGAYNIDSQSYDALVRDAQPAGSTFPTAGNQEYTIVFAAGNAGSGVNTVGSPGTGKNIITAGASENVQPFGGSDGCGVPDTGADHGFDVIGFSSRGPCDDGRKKPELMAPGTHVSGVVAQSSAVATGTGAANGCFNGNGVCGGTGGSNFFPSVGQQFYTASSGTSHSTPAIAGACALVRQFWLNTFAVPPSPAMTKASLMNSATYMTGAGANDTLWSNVQGMGLMNVDRLFTTISGPVILRDEVAADLFTASGQQRIFNGTVADNTKPFRVTLAWTDVPGPTSGNAFVNNLDLEVTVGGNTYKGNVFTGANSATGGTADAADNVESVFIPAGVSGPFVVTVKGTNIAGDGVPGNASPLDQDFALVVTNAVTGGPTAVITSAGATLVAESCTPANGVLDPGETVTVSLCVQNVGTANTAALMGTLQATGGVTNIQPPNPQNYGVVVAGGPAVCRNFTFTAAGTCGGTVTATVHFTDGATDLGNVTYTFTLGTQSTGFTENFDGVTAPALPAGWATTTTNGDGDCTVGGPLCTLGTNWTTVSGTSDTAPNHAFHNDPSCVTDSPLDTPTINLPASASTLTFRNSYATESTFDGGVLEISINGGAFTDIVTAGGTFVTGGYNATISTSFLSPIAGRMAWSGSSGGFITTSVNLPASSQGQPVKLRFRMASDCSVSATGWNIDTISITGGFVCATCPVGTPCVITCPANITKSNDPNQCGAVVTYPAPTSTGTCGTITCTPASGSFFPVGTTTVTCQAATGGGAKPRTDAPNACQTITQSTSQAITALNSVSCNNGIGHTDNSYYRAFTLSSFGIGGAWDVQSVDIGVEEASAGVAGAPSNGKTGFSKSNTNKGIKAPKGGGSQPISVKLYTSSMPFPTGFPGSLTLIGQADTMVADQALTIINVPVTGTAPAGSQLVVEVFTPDGETAGNLFFIGSNASPETGPSYLRAAACGVTNPTTTSALGFPNMHIVMNVNGCDQAVGTGPTCQFTVTVNDTQPPTITCPANIFVAAAATCPPSGCKVVNFTTTATDNCPGVTVVCNPPSGSCFPVGTTTVTCTATDASGNTATCTFTVEVFSACLQDESNPGNVVLFNTLTGEYRFCCNGQLLATGTGVLTMRGCIGSINDQKGTRKVTIGFDFSAFGVGRGTASLFLNGSTDPKCTITDQNMSNNQCTCPVAPPASVGNKK